jgi:hypothetical protein
MFVFGVSADIERQPLLVLRFLSLSRLSLVGLSLVFRCDLKHSRTRLWITKRLRLSATFYGACAVLLTFWLAFQG